MSGAMVLPSGARNGGLLVTRIAYTKSPGRGRTDRLLWDLGTRLLADGWRVCGVVQINSECGPDRPCDMDVKVLPDGPLLRISQALGPGARGCRLDAGALEAAVATVARSLESGADVLLVNKFGKHEAEGRGFRPLIAEALSRDVPVLVGVNDLNLGALEAFADGMTEPVVPDLDALVDWIAGAQRAGHPA